MIPLQKKTKTKKSVEYNKDVQYPCVICGSNIYECTLDE